jgi:transposase
VRLRARVGSLLHQRTRTASAGAYFRLKAEGHNNRQVAKETGVPHSTVDRTVANPETEGFRNGARNECGWA